MILRAGLAIALLVLALDQGLKLWALQSESLQPPGFLPLAGAGAVELGVTRVLNPGIVLGMVLPVTGGARLLVAGMVAAVGAVLLARMIRSRLLLLNLARGAVVGGAASNLLDRVRLGAVVDYLVLTREKVAFVFNLADMAVVLGTLALFAAAAAHAVTRARAA